MEDKPLALDGGGDQHLQAAIFPSSMEDMLPVVDGDGDHYGDEDLNCLPGYRFEPKDHELVVDYLEPKMYHLYVPPNVIHEVELYKFTPDELAACFKPQHDSRIWYFFTPREKKYPNGHRPDRAAGYGYWKATGADKEVIIKDDENADNGVKVGYRKALVFYKGKAPKGVKTNWIMHEYTSANPPIREEAGDNDMRLDDWILCRIYNRSDRCRTGVNQIDSNLLVIPPSSDLDTFWNNLPETETGLPPVNETAPPYQSFSSQDVLPTETAIFPDYNNNMMYGGNLSLEETRMQAFNLYDVTAPTWQNNQGNETWAEYEDNGYDFSSQDVLPSETAIFPHYNNNMMYGLEETDQKQDFNPTWQNNEGDMGGAGNEIWAGYGQISAQVSNYCSSNIQASEIPQLNSYVSSSGQNNIGGGYSYDDTRTSSTYRQNHHERLSAVPYSRYHPYLQTSTTPIQMIPTPPAPHGHHNYNFQNPPVL